MCRWIAYISPTEPCLLEDLLIIPAHAITKQVHDHYLPYLEHTTPGQTTTKQEIAIRNKLFNIDGFGTAYYNKTLSDFQENHNSAHPGDDLRPTLYKNAFPPTHDRNFSSLCKNTASTVVLAHIRAATDTPVTQVNNHPFVFGRHSFMHNGVISDWSSVSRAVADLIDDSCYANVHGSTDSEHLAALYMTFLTQGKGPSAWEQTYSLDEMRDAIMQTISTVFRLQREKLGVEATTPSSLNLATTDGQKLVACRVRNHAVEQPPSLYWTTTAGVTLNRKFPDHPNGHDSDREGNLGPDRGPRRDPKEHGRHVIVASEPITYHSNEWQLVEKNHCVLVERNGQARVERLDIPQSWMTKKDGGNRF